MKTIKILFLLFAFSTYGYANSTFTTTKIKTLIVHDYGGILVVLQDNTVPSAEGCNVQKQVILRRDHYLFKELYASLLAAFHHKTSISGVVNGCYNINNVTSIPIITRLDSNN